MENSVSASRAPSDLVSFSGQTVVGILGLKRYQWPKKATHKTSARDYLESMGAKVIGIKCFLKTNDGNRPSTDPNIPNIQLGLGGQGKINIIA